MALNGGANGGNGEDAHETTPLLATGKPEEGKQSNWVLIQLLICAFLVSLSFSVTQVPIVYVFRLMACDAYYESHPDDSIPGTDRCSRHEIEAGTSIMLAILGGTTTCFGVINLFITPRSIKKFGVKRALLVQTFFPAVRLLIQNIGVMVGSGKGMLIFQCSQIINIVGGPSGYLLALNTFVTEVTEHEARTGALGRLQGAQMFGAAIGFLAGGLIGDSFGILMPFRVTLVLFLSSCLYITTMPYITPEPEEKKTEKSKGLARFFGPLKIFAPQKWVMPDGRVRTEYGAILLALGVFLGVLATGYVQTLLQMYATDIFQFGTKENGWLIFMYSAIRGLFLTLLFPRFISSGRKWLKNRNKKTRLPRSPNSQETLIPHAPTQPNEIGPADPIESEQEPTPLKPADTQETFEFDLYYATASLLVDAVITGSAAATSKGWELYLLAALMPFASGTGSASKGTILQMIPAKERVNALSGITLVETVAALGTTVVFGLIFSGFAAIGHINMVFVCNAAVALLGFCILLLARFPPEGSRRLEHDEIHEAAESS